MPGLLHAMDMQQQVATSCEQSEDAAISDEVGMSDEFVAGFDEGDVERVERVIAAGFDICSFDRELEAAGESLLSQAILLRHLQFVPVLLEAGALRNPNIKDERPLYMAAKNGDVEVVRHLLAAGARHDIRSYGETALYAAVRAGHLETVRELLKAGADSNARMAMSYDTSQNIALKRGYTAIAQLLLEHGADRNVSDSLSQRVRRAPYLARVQKQAVIFRTWPTVGKDALCCSAQ